MSAGRWPTEGDHQTGGIDMRWSDRAVSQLESESERKMHAPISPYSWYDGGPGGCRRGCLSSRLSRAQPTPCLPPISFPSYGPQRLTRSKHESMPGQHIPIVY